MKVSTKSLGYSTIVFSILTAVFVFYDLTWQSADNRLKIGFERGSFSTEFVVDKNTEPAIIEQTILSGNSGFTFVRKDAQMPSFTPFWETKSNLENSNDKLYVKSFGVPVFYATGLILLALVWRSLSVKD